MRQNIQILIADDHPLITEGLQKLVDEKEDMQIAGIAASAKETIALVETTPADILLLDVNFPDGNGVDLCLPLRKLNPTLKLIGLSNFNERSIILRMLHNGASGYLLKSSSLSELEQAIRAVAAGGIYLGTEAREVISHLADHELIQLPPLTKREKEVLQYLAMGYTSPQIGEKMFISSLTVDSHRRSLMEKFKVSNAISLLKKARELGLVP
ncbi:MAG: response regulator transcription factor [Chitinophagaceae bacterium]|nr:response regulator transcription factor [Chitinophagaceae bacterium]